MVLSWTPMSGVQQMALQGNVQMIQAVHASAQTTPPPVLQVPENPNVRSGKEAMRMAIEEVVKVLTDEYYKRYGGLFVTRGFVERRIRAEFEKKHDEIFKLIEQKYMADNVPVRFDPKTTEITYSKSHCMRTVTVNEIASSIIELKERLKEDS